MPRPRSPLKSLAATLDRSGALVALLDDRRQLVYASAACGAWLGVDCEELVGRTAVYSSEPQADSLDAALARLAPPPDAFTGQASETVLASANGVERRQARFVPLPLEGGRYA